MKIKSIHLKKFRRFSDLIIDDLPEARLVVMAGPNGAGKSSILDAFSIRHRSQSRFGINWDPSYHGRDDAPPQWTGEQVKIEFYGTPSPNKSFYIRSAYRNEPDFQLRGLSRQTDPSETAGVSRMIDQDSLVSQNYQRLAADGLEDAYDRHDENMSLKDFREGSIGEIKRAVSRLFPDLELNTLGNPLSEGTFKFTKGTIEGFSYKNLSGGEKSALDLLLDMVIKRRTFDDTVYAIDEPESHMNTRLQGALLAELYDLVPDNSQLWIATHSIGMMRKAQELYRANPGKVIFLDFEGHEYDSPVNITPTEPNRDFWERILKVALDDLADLVAPTQIFVCEGNPKSPVGGKNEEHDARCYNAIFSSEFPDTKFVSGGNSKDVGNDRLKFAAVFPQVIKGITVSRLIDRDDHADNDVADLLEKGIRTLSKRHIEVYLYDDEVLAALYNKHDRGGDFSNMQTQKAQFIAKSIARGNPPDDMKSAAAELYNFIRQDLALTGCGNDQASFARATLVPLFKPEMSVYKLLKADIFGD